MPSIEAGDADGRWKGTRKERQRAVRSDGVLHSGYAIDRDGAKGSVISTFQL
jgi:hypothetical protein